MFVLGLSGRKQAGKDTLRRAIMANTLCELGLVPENTFYTHEPNGQMYVKKEDGMGFIDFDPKQFNEESAEFFLNCLWPRVRNFALADPMKEICMVLFGLTWEQCYGSNDDKNSETGLDWEKFRQGMPTKTRKMVSQKKGKMTARDVLQQFGTGIMREIDNDMWVNATINVINKYKPELAIITDVRFPNEVEGIQAAGGKVVRLTRNPYDDDHASETALDNYENFDFVIPNEKFDLFETTHVLLDKLVEWQIIPQKHKVGRC